MQAHDRRAVTQAASATTCSWSSWGSRSSLLVLVVLSAHRRRRRRCSPGRGPRVLVGRDRGAGRGQPSTSCSRPGDSGAKMVWATASRRPAVSRRADRRRGQRRGRGQNTSREQSTQTRTPAPRDQCPCPWSGSSRPAPRGRSARSPARAVSCGGRRPVDGRRSPAARRRGAARGAGVGRRRRWARRAAPAAWPLRRAPPEASSLTRRRTHRTRPVGPLRRGTRRVSRW